MKETPPQTDLLQSDSTYATELGAAYQGDSRSLLNELPDNCIDLIVTSPPFALQHQKEYGNEDLGEYNDWFMSFADDARRVLQPHGSFVIEIGGAFQRGAPQRSTYQFDLLSRLTDQDEGEFKLAQDLYWFSPAKLPNPIEWVNVRKMRVTDAVTQIWWLAKDINKDPAYTEELKRKVELAQVVLDEMGPEVDREQLVAVVEAIFLGEAGDDAPDNCYTGKVQHLIETHVPSKTEAIDDAIRNSKKAPKAYTNEVLAAVEAGDPVPEPQPRPEANNQRVLQEYSDSQKSLIENGEYNDGERPSGWDIDKESFANENGGSIPKNFIQASNTASNTHYLQMCREFDYEPHPARFPRRLPEFFIDFLTPNPPHDDWDRGYLDRPIVLDLFAGSNLTGKVAEERDRYWLAFEEEEEYLKTSQFRFLSEEQIRKGLQDDQENLSRYVPISSNE